MKEREKKGMYGKITKEENIDLKFSNTLDFMKYEKAREEANERFISNIEKELEIFNESVWEDVKTKKDAIELKTLIESRLLLLKLVTDFDTNEEQKRYENAIDRASITINILSGKISILSNEFSTNDNVYMAKLHEVPPQTIAILADIYRFCIDTKVINENISTFAFIIDAANADFKNTFDNAKVKGKFKYTIYIISTIMNSDEWYKKAANSIETTPSKCSGAFSPDEWKEEINKFKPK